MKRALVLIGLMGVLALATYGGPTSVVAGQYCSSTCPSGSKLECTTNTGTCTAVPGKVTCCGQEHDCAAIDAYNACQNACLADYNACRSSCTVRDPCLADCAEARDFCIQSCGPRPQTSFSC
ncbi:MAG TPA: hypothetical protein VE685_02940 [Thermoanaerobaculia bacterium]|nr:hypothetical protein [Thermoanaerobaculia bacterium]